MAAWCPIFFLCLGRACPFPPGGRQSSCHFFFYEDHRRGGMRETISAEEFIGRMIQHLPPKDFRMVRYYSIYARPVREKIHALVAAGLEALVRRAEQLTQ